MSKSTSQSRGRSYWIPLVGEFENSEGLTHREFAGRYGVPVTTFRYWLYKLRSEPDEVLPAPTHFVELEPPSRPPLCRTVVDLGSVQVHLEELPDARWLAELAACAKGGR